MATVITNPNSYVVELPPSFSVERLLPKQAILVADTVAAVNGQVGGLGLTVEDFVGGGGGLTLDDLLPYATIASPTFTGTVTIPTATITSINGIAIVAGTVDPSAGAGVAAPIGSTYRNTATGVVFNKTGAGNTAWTAAAVGDVVQADLNDYATIASPTFTGTVTIPDADIALINGIAILTGTVDPIAVGVVAPIGSAYHNTATGVVHHKTGAGNNDWAVGGSAPSPGVIDLPPVTDSANEDTTNFGNSMTGATTTVGTLVVMFYTVSGSAQTYLAGETASIAGRGTFSLAANGDYEFIPLTDYNGTVPIITQQVTNGLGDTKIGTITLSVGAVNDAPLIRDDARITLVNTSITIPVLGNDIDPDGDTLTVTHLNGTAVSVGVPVDIGDATVTYQGSNVFLVAPDTDFEGEETFTYTASDGTSSSTATVTIIVGAANNPMFSAANSLVGDIGQAAFNFGLTYRGLYGSTYGNGVNVSVPPYSANQGLFSLLNREPWLYDRATTVYVLYLRTQDPAILADALALADQYMAGVEVTGGGLGRFTIVGGAAGADVTDIKYLYPIIGVWYEQETGLTVHRAKSIALYNQSLLSYSKTYNPVGAALWTERNAGYAILNCTAAYWLHWNAGNRVAAETALADAWDYFTMVEGMSAASGAPLHGHNQHEGSAITTPITSPWMAAFMVEAMIQLYRTDPDVRIPNWIANYGDFLMANAFYATNENDLAGIQGLRLPAYLVANTGNAVTYREGELLDMEHGADVAGLIRHVIWAKILISESTTTFDTLLGELETVAEEVFLYWTRTTEGYPRYRVNPPRKGGWWFRNSYSDVPLFYTAQVSSKPLGITTVSVSGATTVGSLLTATPGTWAGFPTPTLTYQWYRDGAAISGATSTTYTTVSGDGDTATTVRETATNEAGALTVTSNTINTVPAGAPVITVHPDAETKEVGQTAEYTATCTATPTATYQWQVDTGGGWASVSGGSGGSGSGNTTTYTTPSLVSGDNGNLYRCAFTNANGTAYTNSATLSMVVDQSSARFTSNDTGAQLTFDIGALGHADLVFEALVYFEGKTDSANFFGLRHLGNGRSIAVGCNNSFGVYDIGLRDSNTGHTAWATQPTLNTWLHVTIQCQTTAGGDQMRATWSVAEGAAGTRYAVTRANGVEDSVQAQSTFLGGQAIGAAAQAAVRFQYVRARTGYLADATVDAQRHDVDPTGWDYWWRFYDDSGLAVEDKTGNNRVPTLTGGTVATGPVVPGMA